MPEEKKSKKVQKQTENVSLETQCVQTEKQCEQTVKQNKPDLRKTVQNSATNLSVLAMLTAALIVLSLYCTIKTEALNITLTFIPVMIAARLYGAWGAGAVAGLGDIVGYIIRPMGALFPPITITAIITGIVFGLFLKINNIKTGKDSSKCVIAVVIAQLVLAAFVTPLWLNMLYGTSYFTFFVSRLPQIAVMTVVELVAVFAIVKFVSMAKLERYIKIRG